jgi:hypothetical protein
MENKKILKISAILILSGIVIGFSIKPIKKMIANYRGDNSEKNKETTSLKSVKELEKEANDLDKLKKQIEADKITQKEADDLMLQYSKIIKDSNEKFGSMTYQTSNAANKLLDKLYKGGYTYTKVSEYNWKAVKK